MDAQELLVSHLDVIERAVSFVSRRYRLPPDDSEEFAAIVKLKLIENDYAILRKFEGRSTFAAYASVVIQRLFLDYRIRLWGKWHESAEARRLGETAVELERLLHRDGRSLEEAAAILGSVAREEIEEIASRLPIRGPRRREVDLIEAETAAASSAPDLTEERRRLAMTLSATIRRYIDGISGDDQLILQLRFDSGMTVAQIARSLHLDQRRLYRTIERHLRNLRESLEHAGIASSDVDEIIGDPGAPLEFDLRNLDSRPSKGMDVPAAEKELSR